MGNENGSSNVKAAEELEPGEWVVASAGQRNFLGRVVELALGGRPLASASQDGKLEVQTLSRGEVLTQEVLCLHPVYELAINTTINPQLGKIERNPIMLPVDVTDGNAPVYMHPTSIYFFSDMSPSDQEKHRALVHMVRAARRHNGPGRIIAPFHS